MTLAQLHYAITISEMGSLNKASEILYVAQPSLTSAIKELEKELGIVIFHRSGRGVTLTNDGVEFISYARQLYQQYELFLEKYGKNGTLKKKFGVSTQHYSFAVKSFVELVKKFNTVEYEFAIRETKTREVIEDVSTSKSEIGIIYLSDFNRKVLLKLLHTNNLEFHKLVECDAYVYLWKGHPLATCKSIRFEQLADYPRTIKANDRATMLNMMVGLNGYTLCSGIICEELNGTDYIAVPFETEGDDSGSKMEIGYIVRKNMLLSQMGEIYISEMERYLNQHSR